MRSAERRKVNVLEMKWLRSLVGLTRMDRVRNEEVPRKTGRERELPSIADQRVTSYTSLFKQDMIQDTYILNMPTLSSIKEG